MRIVSFVFLLFICYFTQSCEQITSAEEIRKSIADKNQKIKDKGFKVELNLFDCVSDSILVSAQEEVKHCLGNAFSAPVSILSAPIDSILSDHSLDFRYTPFLIEGKIIDIMLKRSHYVETSTRVGAEGKIYPHDEIIFEEMVFLQLESEGKIINVLLDEKGIYSETIGSTELRALDKYLKTDNVNTKELYCKFSGNSEQCFKKGDTVFLAVTKSNNNWNYPQYTKGTDENRFRETEIVRLEKESKSDIFDLSFWHQNKNNMAFIYFINPHKVFKSKEELFKAVDKAAEHSLNNIFMYLACD